MSVNAPAALTTASQPTPILPLTTNPAGVATSGQKMPTLRVGQHARYFGLDWTNRGEQHRYRTKIGLPEVHAAIINHDWDAALELISVEDLGLQWIPPSSQRPDPRTPNGHSSRWASKLLTKDEASRQSAIIEMVSDRVATTTLETNVIAFGANLLTLALLAPVRKDVQDKIFRMAIEENSSYLHLPDGSGRTPLWLAVDKQNIDCVQSLLKAGSDALQPCIFAMSGQYEYPLVHAAQKGNREIFALCLENVISKFDCNDHYPLNVDHLQLKRWAKLSSESDIRWLADKFPAFRNILFSLQDESGTSLLFRSVLDGTLGSIIGLATSAKEVPQQTFSLNPLIGTASELGPVVTPLMQAATAAPVNLYLALLKEAIADVSSSAELQSDIREEDAVIREANQRFIASRSVKDIEQLFSRFNRNGSIWRGILSHLTQAGIDRFCAITKSIWPLLDADNKLELFAQTAYRDDGRTDFVLGLLDLTLTEKTLRDMMNAAVKSGNPTAFAFAAEKSLTFGKTLGLLLTKPEQAQRKAGSLALMCLRAGSVTLFELLLKSGLDLQGLIDSDEDEKVVPQLSDLYADGLSARLQGVQFTITDQMIQHARTAAGKQALRNLKEAGNPGH